MENRLYKCLKQSYAYLGLSDSIFRGQAGSLCAAGLVTDNNLDTVVSALKPFFEALQRMIDQRVGQAIAKVSGRSATVHTRSFDQAKGIRQLIESVLEEKLARYYPELVHFQKGIPTGDQLRMNAHGSARWPLKGVVSSTQRVNSNYLSGTNSTHNDHGLYHPVGLRAAQSKKAAGTHHPEVVRDGYHVLHFTEKMIHSEFKKVLMNLMKVYE